MTNIPKIRTKYGEGIGIELFIQFPDITSYEKTYLSGDEALAQTTLSVISGKNFSANDYVVIGNPGEETCEIRKVSSQTDTTLVTDALDFAHPRGTEITYIPFNQIVVVRSEDSGTTYSALTAVDIRPDLVETYIPRTSDASTDYYKCRFYNSTTTLYSSYSDEVIGTGFAENSVHNIKKRAMDDLGEKIDTDITDDWLNSKLWEARRELDNDKTIRKWSFRIKRNSNIGSIIPGTYTLDVPTDLRKPNTNENILSLRVGEDNQPLDYQDINRFNTNYYNIRHTTLNGTVAFGATTITLTDSGDFDDSGNIYIAGDTVDDSIDVVAYTANAETTNVLSGVTGVQAAGHVTGKDVWQDANFGLPAAYTVDGENKHLQFDIPFDDDYAGENIYMDYYTILPSYNSDGDLLDEPEWDLFVSWLKWSIKQHRAKGKLKQAEDADYAEWLKGKDNIISKERLNQDMYFTL